MIVNAAAYQRGKKISDVTPDQIGTFLSQPDTFVWLGLFEPSAALLSLIQNQIGLHELAIEDAMLAHQRPKLEAYGDTLYLVLHTIDLCEDRIEVGERHFFLGKNFLVTVRHGSTQSHLRVRENCENNPEKLALGPGYALYALMDLIIDNYAPVAAYYEKKFSELESTIFEESNKADSLQKFYQLKREIQILRDAVNPVYDICSDLMHLHSGLLPQQTAEYFRDIRDHVRHVLETVDLLREMLTAAMQVQLALASIAQNEVVKQLAGWGAILAIPTMIFSLYGMNFRFMPELQWRWGYPIMMGVVLVSCAYLFRRLKKIGWL